VFRIRPEHEAALARDRMEQRAEEFLPFLRETYPAQTQDMDDDALLAVVRAARAQAMDYGITSADGLRRFVMLRVGLGPTLFAMPLFDEYMRRGHYTAEERFSAFLDLFIHEAERHARGAGLSWQVE
jgi:hypothetical protein